MREREREGERERERKRHLKIAVLRNFFGEHQQLQASQDVEFSHTFLVRVGGYGGPFRCENILSALAILHRLPQPILLQHLRLMQREREKERGKERERENERERERERHRERERYRERKIVRE